MLFPATAKHLVVAVLQVLYLAEAHGSLTLLCIELSNYIIYFFALYILLQLVTAATMPECCVAGDVCKCVLCRSIGLQGSKHWSCLG